jgi:hypothetical protein
MAEHRGDIYQTNQMQELYNILGHTLGVLDPLSNELQLIVAWDRVREYKLLEKGVRHKRV